MITAKKKDIGAVKSFAGVGYCKRLKSGCENRAPRKDAPLDEFIIMKTKQTKRNEIKHAQEIMESLNRAHSAAHGDEDTKEYRRKEDQC